MANSRESTASRALRTRVESRRQSSPPAASRWLFALISFSGFLVGAALLLRGEFLWGGLAWALALAMPVSRASRDIDEALAVRRVGRLSDEP